MRVKHPTFVHQHGLEGIALQEGQPHPHNEGLSTKYHCDGMVAMDTKTPERKREVKGRPQHRGCWWELKGGANPIFGTD